tara:strand:+ start:366 stop:674 length:309 start_codon:yes stop_codon:yes gene_type:complete
LERDLKTRSEAINYLDKILLKEGISTIVQGKRTTLIQGGSIENAIKKLKRQFEFHERFLKNDDPRKKKRVWQSLKGYCASLQVNEAPSIIMDNRVKWRKLYP